MVISSAGLAFEQELSPDPAVGMKLQARPDFEEFYRSARDSAERFAYLLVGDESRAEDAVSEAFFYIYRRWKKIRNPQAYLRRAVTSACAQEHRKRHKELARFKKAVPQPDPEIETSELRDLVEMLPFKQRAVVILFYYEGLKEKEIAETLKIRLGTVKSLKSRALQKLQGEVKE